MRWKNKAFLLHTFSVTLPLKIIEIDSRTSEFWRDKIVTFLSHSSEVVSKSTVVVFLTRWQICSLFLFRSGLYLNNFIVGLTDESPETTPVSLWNYDLCGQYPTTVPDAVTVYLQCDQSAPPRRYLVVQRPTTTYLEFCEIEVYLRRKSKLLAYTLASCYSPKCTVA